MQTTVSSAVLIRETLSSSASPVNAFLGTAGRQQILVLRSDIPDALSGPVTAIELLFESSPSDQPGVIDSLLFSMAHTSSSTLSDFESPAFITVLVANNVMINSGWNRFVFDTHFNYDVSENILIQVCMDTTSTSVQYTISTAVTSGARSAVAANTFSSTGTTGCTLGPAFVSTQRPVLRLDVTQFSPQTPIINYFSCTCPTGYTGTQCEVDVDEVTLPHKNI